MTPANRMSIGKITGTHGVRGVLKFYSAADGALIAACCAPGQTLWLASRVSSSAPHSFCALWVKPHGRSFLLALDQITDLDLARGLVGAEVWVARASLPPLEPDTYYQDDLIGLDVHATDIGYIGRVEEIFTNGAQDVYVVRDDATERLIPAVASIVRRIDLASRRMQVDLPDGL